MMITDDHRFRLNIQRLCTPRTPIPTPMKTTTTLKLIFAALSLIGVFVFPAYDLLFMGMFVALIAIILLEFDI